MMRNNQTAAVTNCPIITMTCRYPTVAKCDTFETFVGDKWFQTNPFASGLSKSFVEVSDQQARLCSLRKKLANQCLLKYKFYISVLINKFYILHARLDYILPDVRV